MADAAAPAPLVALRDRRDHVIAVLTDLFSRDLLEVDELERRLERAQRADSVAAVDAVIADLVAEPSAPPTALATRAVPAAALASWPKRRRMTSIFASVEKGGAWTAAQTLTVTAVFGSTELDFREAVLAPGVTELRIRCVFGSVELIVPPWLAVESEATAVMGSFEELHRAPALPDPDRPILRITGATVFGSVEIETRLPGESRREARRRAKRNARALAGTPPAALPPARARLKDD